MTWPVLALGDVMTIDRIGITPSSILPGTPYVGLENIERGGRITGVNPTVAGQLASSKFCFDTRHVLFGKLRPNLQKIARPDFDGICSTDILPLRPGPRLDRDYLAHFLALPAIVRLATLRAAGVNLPRLSPTELQKFQIPLPPIDEQRRVADILDRADAIGTKRRETLTMLDDLTESIFLDMFGDPGQNPRQWPTSRLSELVTPGDRINYGVLQPGGEVSGGVGLVRVGDLVAGRVRHLKLKHIDPAVESGYKRSRIRGNEVLVSCVGSIGAVAVVDEADVGLNVARAVSRVPIGSPSFRRYVAAHLRTSAVQRYFKNELRTVAQPTLNVKQLAETRIMRPPEAKVDEFANLLARLQSTANLYLAAQDELTALLASVKQRAFAGLL